MAEAVIVAGTRTAVGRANKGTLVGIRPEAMGAHVVKSSLEQTPDLKHEEVEDLIIGCSFPEGEQGLNMARMIGFRAGLPESVPAITVNRYCSSGLQTIVMAAERIIAGFANVILAGGVENMSAVPIGGNKLSPDPYLVENYPEAYLTMGLTAENVANRYGISRENQDRFALESHQKALAAIKEGKFKDEISPMSVIKKNFINGKVNEEEVLFSVDEGPRPDTTLKGLAKLRPAFAAKGSVTAGNSSQTSDGAAVVTVMSSDKANKLGLESLGKFKAFAVAGVAPDEMGIGPVAAIPKVLKAANLSIDQIDLFEINEAFASQALYVIRELGIDSNKVNVNGGAIALGHPLGCTGTKLTLTLLHEMKKRNNKYGIVSMCIGGGMGAAAIFERI